MCVCWQRISSVWDTMSPAGCPKREKERERHTERDTERDTEIWTQTFPLINTFLDEFAFISLTVVRRRLSSRPWRGRKRGRTEGMKRGREASWQSSVLGWQGRHRVTGWSPGKDRQKRASVAVQTLAHPPECAENDKPAHVWADCGGKPAVFLNVFFANYCKLMRFTCLHWYHLRVET